MSPFKSTWIVLAVLLALVLWLAAIYNRLRQKRNRVENAWAQIDVQLKRRHDLIPNLVEVARAYMAHEASTLEAVTRARSQAVSATSAARGQLGQSAALDALMQAEQGLASSLGRLMVVSEAYPQLQADARMQSLAEEIASTENRIGYARQAYNDQVLDYNDQASRLPDLLLARPLGFNHMAMLQSTTSARERAAPEVRF